MNVILLREGFVSELLDSTARLVLVNAIYYKNFWKIRFPKNSTRNEVFYIDRNTIKEVPTMHIKTSVLTG